MWTGALGSPAQLLCREAMAAPGTDAGVYFSSMVGPWMSAGDQAVFAAVVDGPGITPFNAIGLWKTSPSGTTLLARNGSQAANVPAGISYVSVNPAGITSNAVTWVGHLSGTGVNSANEAGLWYADAKQSQLIARTGDSAPGPGPSLIYAYFGELRMSDSGLVAFSGYASTSDSGLWTGTPGALTRVARSGDAAPQTSASFSTLYSPSINNAGAMGFSADLSGAGVTPANNTAIFSGRSGDLHMVAREGDQVPGAPAGVVFAQLYSPLINGAGQTVFMADLTGSGVTADNNKGVFIETSQGLRKVVRLGDVMPGDPQNRALQTLWGLSTNSAGDVVFGGQLYWKGWYPGLGEGTTGLWWWNDSELEAIAVEGTLFDVDPGPGQDLRRINDIGARGVMWTGGSGGEDGSASSLSDNRQILFSLSMERGTQGLFVATVPEPAGMSLGLLAAAGMLLRRRVR
jgi:hypothetical protein